MSDHSTLHNSLSGHPWTDNNVWPSGKWLGGYMAIGLVAGIASAMLGIGSGVLIVPLLSGWFHVPIKRAVGISIVSVFGVVLVGVIAEAITTDNIHWFLAIMLAVGAQSGVRLGGWLSTRISNNVLRWSFIVMLIFTALKLAGLIPGDTAVGLFDRTEICSAWILTVLALGGLAGTLSVMLGIGGGIVAVPGLLFLVNEMSFQAARATSLAMIVPTSLAGTFTHASHKNVLWRSVIAIVVPGCVGAITGVILANIIPGAVLRGYVFPIFLGIMVIRLVFAKSEKE